MPARPALTIDLRRATYLLALTTATALLSLLAFSGMARAASPGSANTSFAATGSTSLPPNTELLGTAVQSNGDVVGVGESGVGTSPKVMLVRWTPSGALDATFGTAGVVTGPTVSGASNSLGRAVAIEPNGQIVVVGTATDPSGTATDGILVERYNANGSLDTSFGSGGSWVGGGFGSGYAVALQPNGDIVAAGSEQISAVSYTTVVRLTSAGAPDSSFGKGGTDVIDLGTNSELLAAALQSNGDIVVAGQQIPNGESTNSVIARLTPSGALDPTFAGTGAYVNEYNPGGAYSSFTGLAIQSNGDIVGVGDATGTPGTADAFVVRFTPSGAQDPTFGSGGVAHAAAATDYNGGSSGSFIPGASSVALAPNGDIIAAGQYADSIITAGTVWAFTPTGALDSTFGTSGTTAYKGGGNQGSMFAGLGLSPVTGDLFAVGDSGGLSTPDSGLAASYVGYGPPKTVTPPPPPAFSVTVGSLSASQKIATVSKSGLKFSAACNQACSLSSVLSISAGTAKQLKLGKTVKQCKKVHGKTKCSNVKVYKAMTLASSKATLGAAGTKVFTLRLSSAVAKAMAKQKKSVSVTLTVAGTSATTHKKITVTKHLKFTK